MKKACLFALLAVLPLASVATPITVGFSGVVDNDPFGSGWSTFSGQFIYDSAWSDAEPAAYTDFFHLPEPGSLAPLGLAGRLRSREARSAGQPL